MGFQVVRFHAGSEPMVEMTERLCLTEDGRLVDELDADARWLYCVPGALVPLSEARRYGLVPAEPEPEQPKAQRPAANKMRAKREDK